MLLVSLSIFATVAFMVMALYWLVFRPASATTERLSELQGLRPLEADLNDENPLAVIAERVAEPFQRLVPPSAAEVAKLQLQLMQAGYRSHNAPSVFRAIQFLMMLALPSAVSLFWLFGAKPWSSALVWLLMAFAVGFFIPRFILKRKIKKRQLRITWGLADALDLMVVTMEAGLGLNSAMVRVSEELKDVHPDISKEFELANLEVRVGRERNEALRNLVDRTGVEDLRSLVAMLIQADRFGTSIAKAVRVYADALRTKRRQRAEQAAQKAAFKLLFPLGVFLFPTLFIMVLGPALLNIIDLLAQ
jgi:tight adherence protein C